jgi:hypothetical protein
MGFQHMKSAIIGGWALGLGAIGLSVDVRSPGGWMLLVGLGMLPPLMLLRMWHQPAETRLDGLRGLIGAHIS